MRNRKRLLTLVIIIALIAVWLNVRKAGVATYNDYQACVDAGGSTIERDPPTCFHPNGTDVTPGHKIIER